MPGLRLTEAQARTTVGSRRRIVRRAVGGPGRCQVFVSDAADGAFMRVGARDAFQGDVEATLEDRRRMKREFPPNGGIPPVGWIASLAFEPSASRQNLLPPKPGRPTFGSPPAAKPLKATADRVGHRPRQECSANSAGSAVSLLYVRLLLATTQPRQQVREIRQLLDGVRCELVSLDEWPNVIAPEETGRTFEENARAKARVRGRDRRADRRRRFWPRGRRALGGARPEFSRPGQWRGRDISGEVRIDLRRAARERRGRQHWRDLFVRSLSSRMDASSSKHGGPNRRADRTRAEREQRVRLRSDLLLSPRSSGRSARVTEEKSAAVQPSRRVSVRCAYLTASAAEQRFPAAGFAAGRRENP